MIVCSCRSVNARTVRRAIKHGATTPAEISAECGAGSCCGGCIPSLDAMIREHCTVTQVGFSHARA